jgi:hypothetical protein
MRAIVNLLALALLLAAAPAPGQESGEAPSPPSAGRIGQEFIEEMESREPVITAPVAGPASGESPGGVLRGAELMPELVDPAYLDEAGLASMRAALKAFYDYRIKGFDHRSRVFEWQLLSSRLIFVLVIAIVAVGLYFSWLQFMAGLREKAGTDTTSTTFEASPTGLKVSSPVLGVIILTLSLAFFYLYLVHVYPIEEIF